MLKLLKILVLFLQEKRFLYKIVLNLLKDDVFMRLLSFVILFLFSVSFLFSQSNNEIGKPSLKNFSSRDYGHENQNFSVLQDTNMIMYFGNSNGIMEFDNSSWRLIKGMGIPMMDINYNNEIFFGGFNSLGKLVYKDGLPEPYFFKYGEKSECGKIKKVVALNDLTFFSSEDRIMLYRKGDDNIEVIKSETPGVNIFKIDSCLVAYFPNEGVFYWENDKFRRNVLWDRFTDIDILDIIGTTESRLVIKLKGNGFLKITDGNIEPFITEVDDFVRENEYSTAEFHGEKLLIGTRYGGLVCINNKGKYTYSLSITNGLNDNYITDIFIDKYGHTWLTTFNGISLIEAVSDITFFDNSFGLSGSVLSICRFNEVLYVGTSNGIFYLSDSNVHNNDFDIRTRFVKIPGIKTICWQIVQIGDKLYGVTDSGVYLISQSGLKLLLKGDYKRMLVLKSDNGKCLIGGWNGVILADFSYDNIDTLGYLKNFSGNAHSITEDFDNNLWIGTEGEGLFGFNFKEGFSTDVDIKDFSKVEGFPPKYRWVDVFYSRQGIIFSTDQGAFRHNSKKDIFYEDELFGIDFSKKDRYLYPLIEDSDNNIWYSCIYNDRRNRQTGVFNIQPDFKYIANYKSFALLSDYIIESIYPEPGSRNVWFGTSDALIKFGGKAGNNNLDILPCLIRKMRIGRDSVIYIDPNTSVDYVFSYDDYKDNSIRFDFTGLSYSSSGPVSYQVMLYGFKDHNRKQDNKDVWSEWTTDDHKEYTYLRAFLKTKNYTFKVKARDIYGNESEEAILKFSLKPPFYFSIFAFIIYFIIIATIIVLIFRLNSLRHAKVRYDLERIVEERTKELARQKEETEKLVKKLLPQNAAEELRDTGNAKSEKYDMVTVLFADIKGFTKIALESNTEELITYLNNLFGIFDKIISKYNIEKIKTIGDAYMCAGGMPLRDNINPVEVVLAGLEMQREIKKNNEKNKLKLEVRIGIHTGPVVTGVIGTNKIEYDIWGDTVNIASRMESYGEAGRINISAVTYNEIKDFFDCESRGAMQVKYKGEIEMYFVDKIKAALSDDGIIPNKEFGIKLQFIKYKMIEEEVLNKLQMNLPSNLYYHNVKHTIDVIFIVEDIARQEGVSNEEMLLLKCAALFHDAGFMVSYDNNEKIGADLAEETLKRYKFSKEQIETVKRLILSTKMPHNPKDLLEKIINDADLDYLGRPDFIPVSQNLFRELYERDKISTISQWNKMQYKFVREHSYYTSTAREKRDPGKQTVLNELENMI